jgi:hypothetical protein
MCSGCGVQACGMRMHIKCHDVAPFGLALKLILTEIALATLSFCSGRHSTTLGSIVASTAGSQCFTALFGEYLYTERFAG